MPKPLAFLKTVLEGVVWVLGLGLIAYIGLALFDLVSHSDSYYVTFALVIVSLSGALALIDLIDQFCAREGEFFSHPVRDAWLLFKTALVVAAAVLGIIGYGYFRIHIERLATTAPFFESLDVTMGFLMIFSIIVLTWAHWGWLLASLSGAAIAYFFFGEHVPTALLRHPGYNIEFIMNYLSLNTNQGFLQYSGVAADDIFMLIYFGVVMMGVGILKMVIEIGRAAGTRVKGGAALPAVIGSSAIGSVMGQAVSNVVLTGRLTIPMMKRYHYDPSMAAAIEATASSIGQLMPPILGLAGFLIASFIGMPYVEVALASLIPAVLFIIGVALSVWIYAVRNDIPRVREAVDRRLILRMLPAFVIPLGLVVWLLLGFRAAGFAGLVGIVAALALALFQGPYRPSWVELRAALREGIVLTTVLSLLIFAIGPVGQAMITTNLSGRLATTLATILPDIELLLLVGAMILSIFLGMGLPTPIAYVVASLVMVPFLQEVGVPVFQAHFFVFYFAVFSTLTPPIAVSVLAAAKLAEAPFRKAATDAMKIAGCTFIIPFAFIFNPQLLEFPNIDGSVLMPLVEVILTQLAWAITAYGYCFKRLRAAERLAFGVVTAIGYWTLTTYGRPVMLDIILSASMVVVTGWCWFSARHEAAISRIKVLVRD